MSATTMPIWASSDTGEGAQHFVDGIPGYSAQAFWRNGEILVDVDASATITIPQARELITALEAAIAEAMS